jgi:shikimate 5-dehydrogenase
MAASEDPTPLDPSPRGSPSSPLEGAADQAGRVVVVTGGASGVGRAFAGALAARGATVVLVARSEARGEEACAAIRRETPGARVRADLARDARERVLAREEGPVGLAGDGRGPRDARARCSLSMTFASRIPSDHS